MNDKLLNKSITLSAKEEKLQGGKPVAKIKDEKGLTYTVYRLKQDRTESVAWGQLSKLSLGQTVQIGYVKDLGEYEGKKVIYRTIRNFNEDLAGMTQDRGTAGNSQPGANSGSTEASPGRNWDKEAYEKCCSIWAAALLGNGKTVTSIELDGFHNLFQAIRAAGEKHFNPSKLRQAVTKYAPQFARAADVPGTQATMQAMTEELPTIDVGEADSDMPVEGIPF